MCESMCVLAGRCGLVLALALSMLGCMVSSGGGGGGGSSGAGTGTGTGTGTGQTGGSGLLGNNAGSWEIYKGCKLSLTGSAGSADCAMEPEVKYADDGTPINTVGKRTFTIGIAESKVTIGVTTTAEGIFTVDKCDYKVKFVENIKGDALKASGKQESGLFTAFAGKWSGTLALDQSTEITDVCKSKTDATKKSAEVKFDVDLGGSLGTIKWQRIVADKVVSDDNNWSVAGSAGKVTLTSASGNVKQAYTKQ